MKKSASHNDLKSSSRKTVKKENVATGISPWYFLLGILLLTLGIYSNSLRNNLLTFDDNEYFSMYPEIVNLSWSSIKLYFTKYYVIMYQPLPVLTFALNYHFSGFNTFPMHFFNLVFHLINIVLVFKLVSLITKNRNTSLIVALLFAVHPMNVEAVSWISARSSSMYTAFYLAGLIFYVRYLDQSKIKLLILTGVFFLLSLFSKAQAVTFPVVLLLFDFLSGRKLLSPKVIVEKIPFFILSIVFGIVTIMNTGTMSNLTKGMLVDYNPVDIFFIVCYSFSFYFVKLVAPINLCGIYVYPPKTDGMLPMEYYGAALLMVALIYVVWKMRHNRMFLFCVGFFFITIAINIQLIPSRLFIVADRYSYMPYLGLFLLIPVLLEQLKESKLIVYNKYFPYALVFLTVFTIGSSFAVVKRNKTWNNDIVFLSDIISKNPPVGYIYRAYGNRGLAYKNAGKLSEAVNDFSEAIKLDSTDGRNYFNRALTYNLMQNYQSALYDVNKAIEITPNQSMLYNTRSQLKFNLNDLEGSEADCKKTIEIDSLDIDAWNTLANIAFNRKQFDLCEKYLSQAILIKPDFAIALKNRGLLYIQLNRVQDACSDFVQAANFGSEEAKLLKGQYCK